MRKKKAMRELCVIHLMLLVLIAPAHQERGGSAPHPVQAPLFNIIPALDPTWFQFRSQLQNFVDVQAQLDAQRAWATYRNARSAMARGDLSSAERGLMSMINNASTLDPLVFSLLASLEALRGHSASATRSNATAARLSSPRRPCPAYPPRPHQPLPNATAIAAYAPLHAAMLRPTPTLSGRGGGGAAAAEQGPGGRSGGGAGKRGAEEEEEEEGGKGGGRRFLVCQPTFGLGNRVNALIMCWAVAIATRRALLVHWNCVSCARPLEARTDRAPLTPNGLGVAAHA